MYTPAKKLIRKLEPLVVPEKKPADALEMAGRTVALVLTKGKLGNRRKVSSSQVEVNADKEWVGVTKRLFNTDALAEINSLDGEIDRYLDSRAFPSMLKKGVYLLPVNYVEEVSAKMADFEAKRKVLVAKLVSVYDSLVDEARERLNDLFEASDYPSARFVEGAFRLRWQFVSFSTPASIQQINRAVYDQELKKAQQRLSEAAETIQQVLRAKMLSLVEHMTTILSPNGDGKKKIFRDNSVEKLQEFITSFPISNVTSDDQLKALVNRASELMTGVDPELLRDSSRVRNFVCDGFSEIKSALTPLVTVKPKRAISLEVE